eukprot:7691365-Ditylum_brightwellii.AAC.1
MLMLNWVQKSARVQHHLLEDTKALPHLEEKWLKQRQQEMATTECTIHLPDTWQPEPSHIGDK